MPLGAGGEQTGQSGVMLRVTAPPRRDALLVALVEASRIRGDGLARLKRDLSVFGKVAGDGGFPRLPVGGLPLRDCIAANPPRTVASRLVNNAVDTALW